MHNPTPEGRLNASLRPTKHKHLLSGLAEVQELLTLINRTGIHTQNAGFLFDHTIIIRKFDDMKGMTKILCAILALVPCAMHAQSDTLAFNLDETSVVG